MLNSVGQKTREMNLPISRIIFRKIPIQKNHELNFFDTCESDSSFISRFFTWTFKIICRIEIFFVQFDGILVYSQKC